MDYNKELKVDLGKEVFDFSIVPPKKKHQLFLADFLRASADDEAKPDYVETFIEALRTTPEVCFYGYKEQKT